MTLDDEIKLVRERHDDGTATLTLHGDADTVDVFVMLITGILGAEDQLDEALDAAPSEQEEADSFDPGAAA